MSVTTPCPEDISSETLSAWADGGLPEAEAARLRAHTQTCPACQERLRAYSDIRRLMSGQRIPPAPPVDIAAVRAGQSRQDATHRADRRGIARAVWGGLGAAIAAALLIAAFSQVFARLGHVAPTATATPAATATPTASKLSWTQRTLPPGVNLSQANAAFAVSPVTSQKAWACLLAPDGKSITIWGTTDQARSWKVVGRLTPLATPQPIGGFTLIPDDVKPNVLALTLGWGSGEAGTLGSASYISGDGGATWRKLPGEVSVSSLATLGSRTYAIVRDTTVQTATPSPLLVSDDGLSTWHVFAPKNVESSFFYMWPDPSTGVLLGGSSNTLWRTNDGGATWTHITFTNNVQIEYGVWLSVARHWRICGKTPSTSAFPPLLCTDDLGQTWNPQASLNLSVTCRDCNKGGGPLIIQDSCYAQTIALDGSLLALCQPAGTVTADQTYMENVYRLASGATTWQSLGPVPSPGTAHEYGGIYVYGVISATGDSSSSGGALWYIDPTTNILAVAPLPS